MNTTKKTKTYTKPDVEAVNFVLSSNWSSGCRHIGTFSDSESCGYDDNGFMIFMDKCDIVSDSEFCYHVPTADSNVFQS